LECQVRHKGGIHGQEPQWILPRNAYGQNDFRSPGDLVHSDWQMAVQ